MNQNNSLDFSKEMIFLFNIMSEELKEYNLTQLELLHLFHILRLFIIASSTTKYKLDEEIEEMDENNESEGFRPYSGTDPISRKKRAEVIEKKEKFDITQDILERFSNWKSNPFYKYKLAYFFNYFDDNNHLLNVLNKYQSKYKYPQDRLEVDYYSNAYRLINKTLFPNGICCRVKNTDSEGWSLKSFNEELIKLEDAVYVWEEKEGAFRFITRKGIWGFALNYTHEIIYLPNNIIQMEDFSCFRARVLVSNKNELYTTNVHWGYIDMRGNIVSKDEYESASDYVDNIATVSIANYAWEMGFSDCVKNPDANLEIDVFGNMTDETIKKREIIEEEGEKIRRNREWNKMMSDGGLSDDEIIEAISNGNGDIMGY